jgi:mitosis inhibitor protein kinase SWE1
MTTSSSNSSLVDESPTHVPPHFGEQPRPKIDFSKSLPVGSLRPFVFDNAVKEDGSYATPQNYKAVKPLPAAFMSTGLISKVNRHPEQPVAPRDLAKDVPDTPCKKQFNGFATYPAPMPGSALAKARHIRHSFGTPSTPFNPNGGQLSSLNFGKSTGIFGGSFGRRGLSRRGSFLSLDGDESCGGTSPDANVESQTSAEFEFPGTPTKQVFTPSFNGSPSHHRPLSTSLNATDPAVRKKLNRTSSKFGSQLVCVIDAWIIVLCS